DLSTVDLLAYLGQRCAGLRLLVLLTYRPTELRLGAHPFLAVQRELQGRGVCREIALSFLERPDIERYLALTFPQHGFPAELGALLHGRTGGNPLFLCDLVRYLRDRGVLAETQGRWVLAQAVPDLRRELPASVRSLIDQKIARLDEAGRRLLTAASVQGQEFDAAVVAQALLLLDPAGVEEQCEGLASVHGLVRQQGEQELPDGTLTLRFQFVHVLYQNALYDALSPARRAALSAAVAQALTGFYRDQPGAIASEVARLWETARDWSRAADAFCLAAANAVRVFAHTEAVTLARHGLELLDKLPDSRARAEQELRLQGVLSVPLAGIRGLADVEVGKTCSRALQLCRLLGETGPLFRTALSGLWAFHLVRAEMAAALDLSHQQLALAQSRKDRTQWLTGHNALGIVLVYQGDFAPSLEHLKNCLTATEQVVLCFGYDLRSTTYSFAAWTLWALGYSDQAQATARAAIVLAQQFPRSLPLVHAHLFAAVVDQLRRDAGRTLKRSETVLELCREEGFPFHKARGTVWHGWALAALGEHDEGLREIRQGRAAYRALGAVALVAHMFGLEAEVLAQTGQSAAALDAVSEGLALAESTGDRFYEAELHRLRGELLLGRAEAAEAEACFGRALEVARRQQAKSWELRAALSLSRLYHQQGKSSEARQLLANVYSWFTEGHDSADLQEARTFLDSLPLCVPEPAVPARTAPETGQP
ncbi:MAG: hypothetical protein JO112_19520, partial [Planctomycetes bacterium]|nr:hypothetical protein [Planctomycetota bacterium]